MGSVRRQLPKQTKGRQQRADVEVLLAAGILRAQTTKLKKAQHQNVKAWRTLHPVRCP